ncbi:MAG: UDP-N-acetylglucosamine--N-acetylmuramyl-(pentapeptide) pyrophosphoryl-undecaprenol N-acetylglucosamine transferase, partial [Bacteroidia bacterium]
LIQEQNSFAGITNKWLSQKASRICVAYEGMEKFFPKEKIMLTGNPVRQDINSIKQKREEALRFFTLDPDKKTILIIGGSLGARTINEAMDAGLEKLKEAGVQILWQTGKTYFPQARKNVNPYHKEHLFAFDFISRMDLAYAAADIVVSRAGASSVSELCNIEMPCILVPSPNVAEDHQTKNAMALVSKRAAVLVKDAEAKDKLVAEAISLVKNPARQSELSRNISTMAFHDSASVIAAEVLKLAKYP